MNPKEEVETLRYVIDELQTLKTMLDIHGMGLQHRELRQMAKDLDGPITLLERHRSRLKRQKIPTA